MRQPLSPERGTDVAAPAADQALRILTFLASRVEPTPAAAIARTLGLPRSTAYRLLAVLSGQDYVQHYPQERTWGLGPAAYELSSGYQRQAPLQRRARPLLQRLVDRTTHNAHLAVLHGRDVLYVIEERAPHRPLLISDVGVRLPATTTASGLAMLAALPAQQVTALFPSAAVMVGAESGGPATPTALRRLLVDARRRGYAVEDGTVTPGLASVAVPVLDRAGHPVASVAITFERTEIDAPEEARLADAARTVADQLG